VSAQYSDTVSTAPTVQLCTNTVAFAGPVELFARVTDTLVSKYGTVVEDSVPLVVTCDTCTVTTLDTNCGGGSVTVALLLELWLVRGLSKRVPGTSTVVTTTATAPPPGVDGSAMLTVVPLSGNAIAYDGAVPLRVALVGRTTATATVTPSAVTVVTVPEAAVPLPTSDRNASSAALITV
jgi:hypothetical protein